MTMMSRLTADLILHSDYGLNPLKERELNLRGNKIPTIENLGATNDSFDSLDMCYNEITRVENFPLLKRLTTLLLANNRIASIASEGLGEHLPNLRVLVLTNNRISILKDLDGLAGLKKMPQVRFLDGSKIKQTEREESIRVFGETETAKQKKQQQKQKQPIKTPSTSMPQAAPAPAPTTTATTTTEAEPMDVESIKVAIEGATSLQEIERLGKLLEQRVNPPPSKQ